MSSEHATYTIIVNPSRHSISTGSFLGVYIDFFVDMPSLGPSPFSAILQVDFGLAYRYWY